MEGVLTGLPDRSYNVGTCSFKVFGNVEKEDSELLRQTRPTKQQYTYQKTTEVRIEARKNRQSRVASGGLAGEDSRSSWTKPVETPSPSKPPHCSGLSPHGKLMTSAKRGPVTEEVRHSGSPISRCLPGAVLAGGEEENIWWPFGGQLDALYSLLSFGCAKERPLGVRGCWLTHDCCCQPTTCCCRSDCHLLTTSGGLPTTQLTAAAGSSTGFGGLSAVNRFLYFKGHPRCNMRT